MGTWQIAEVNSDGPLGCESGLSRRGAKWPLRCTSLRSPTWPEETPFKVLTPYDPREGIGLKEAAARAGKSETTLRNWCVQHGLGRRVGGGVWVANKALRANDHETSEFEEFSLGA